MKRNDVLIIIVAYNSMQWAERCYSSLRTSNVPCDIITIDNGSTDGTQNFIRSNYPEVELVETNENLGFGRANNIGLQKAIDKGYEYVYLLNQDAWIFPNTLEKLISFQKRNKQYGILSPMQLDGSEESIDKPFLHNIICEGIFRTEFINDYYFNKKREVYDTHTAPAAHWLISRDCLLSIGGFSPSFPHYGEDDNYAQRALYHNYKFGIIPTAKAIHNRENRKPDTSKKKQLYNTYIKILIKSSNPQSPLYNNARHWGLKFFLRGLKNMDYGYIRLAKELWKRNKEIDDNTKQTIKGFSFLKIPMK